MKRLGIQNPVEIPPARVSSAITFRPLKNPGETDNFELTRVRQDAASGKTAESLYRSSALCRAPQGASARVRSVRPLAGVL